MPLVSEGKGPGLGAQQAFWARLCRANSLRASPAPPGSWRAPLPCLSCSPSASLLCPQDQRGPEGTSEGIAPGRARQASQADWASETLGALPPIWAPEGPFRRGNPSPLPATPQVLSGFYFSSPLSPPMSYLFACRFLLSPWVPWSPTSIWKVL